MIDDGFCPHIAELAYIMQRLKLYVDEIDTGSMICCSVCNTRVEVGELEDYNKLRDHC